VTATTDHPTPMQLVSTSVGAAAKKHAVPPKPDNGISSTLCGVTSLGDCMIVDGYICGQKARILIDSGARMSHISSTFVSQHQLDISTSPIPTVLVMGDGHKRVTDRLVCNAEIRLGELNENIDMLVMDMTHYDGILGMNWHYAHYPVTYDTGSISYTHHDNTYVLRRDDDAYHNIKSKYFVSAVALTRMLRLRRIRAAGGDKGNRPSCQLYATYNVSSVDAKHADSSRSDDEYRAYFMKHYPAVCGDPPLDLPPMREFDHHIELLPGSEPIAKPAYRESASHNDELRRQLDELLKAGYIRPSNSEFASPILFVKKADGSLRMCIDYRGLNKITKKNKYPLPHTDDLIERLKDGNYLTKLDLRSGYHQLRMGEDSVNKTAFITRYGLYEFLVMPFGLCNAPSTFMRMMHDILRPLIDTCVIVFLDDILIYSPAMEQHYKDVSAVFDLLKQHKLYVKMSKCEFFKHELEFLGHIVGKGSVKMCPDKLDAIRTWPVPTNIHDLRSFLGMCGYYRKFVKGFSDIATPLFDLTKKDQRHYNWQDVHQYSFEQLREALLTGPVLQLPDHNKDWIMYCDACGTSIGGVLAQHDDKGDIRPVLFMSHKLGGAELNWPVHDKEMYAIIYMFKVCRMYVQGKHVTVYTDHRSLQHFMTQPSLSPRQTRWMEYLASYDWTIVYKEGKYNVVADALSRRPSDDATQHDTSDDLNVFAISCLLVADNFMEELKDGYLEDPTCQSVLENNGTAILSVRDGYIYKGTRLYVPCIDSLRKKLLVEYHDVKGSGGHRGVAATHHKLIQHYYWPHMYEDVVTYVKECYPCQQSKNVNQRPAGLLQPLPIPEHPLEDISMDFITRLPRTITGHTGILVVVDRFSKYVKLIPTTSNDESGIPAAERTAELFLQHWATSFGIPKSIVSDRDPQFTSKFWIHLFSLYGTSLNFTSTYHPESDGQTERTNRTLEEVLRAYVGTGQLDWDEHLWHAQVAINTSRQQSTGEVPHTLLFGKPMHLPVTRTYQSH
jgi:hypothetical protein